MQSVNEKDVLGVISDWGFYRINPNFSDGQIMRAFGKILVRR